MSGIQRIERKTIRDVVQLPSGTSLEYTLLQPAPSSSTSANTEDVKKVAICLHPWSWLGGRMDDPVLQIVTEPLLERGYEVLRYNTRGAGKSKGWPSLTGSQEVEDLKDLAEWVRSNTPSLAKLVILGYSHGSLIASMYPVLSDVDTSHILLSYPLGPRHWLTAFRSHRYTTALQNLITNPNSRVLVVYGDQDDFTSAQAYDSWAEQLRSVRESNAPDYGTLKIVKVEGASHFWREHAAVHELIETVREWVE
ncbi:alpha/beta-hydrolase [Cubamyces sp. BRFM 1775]|nr:alpha/beta-hydrolase [Cubamyces sp. BRFM 1775]